VKDKRAVSLGRLGGVARAKSLAADRRSEIAKSAAVARWGTRCEGLATVFRLSDFYRESSMGRKRKPAPGTLKEDLIRLSAVLDASGTEYAIIGGIAIQPRRAEPRTTEDIDVAVSSWDDIPRRALRAAGFHGGKRFKFSENWKAPGGTAVQFSSDVGFAGVVAKSETISGAGVRFRAASVTDLMWLKADAALEPRRRLTKKLTDVGDVVALVKEHKADYEKLSASEMERVDKVIAKGEAFAALLSDEPSKTR